MAVSVYRKFGQIALTGQGLSAKGHTLLSGETIPQVAAYEYQTGYDSEAWRQIAEYNEITDLDSLTAGQLLAIPPLNEA